MEVTLLLSLGAALYPYATHGGTARGVGVSGIRWVRRFCRDPRTDRAGVAQQRRRDGYREAVRDDQADGVQVGGPFRPGWCRCAGESEADRPAAVDLGLGAFADSGVDEASAAGGNWPDALVDLRDVQVFETPRTDRRLAQLRRRVVA